MLKNALLLLSRGVSSQLEIKWLSLTLAPSPAGDVRSIRPRLDACERGWDPL